MHSIKIISPNSILETEKTLKTLSSAQIYKKIPQKTKQKQNNQQKKPKKNHWAGFFFLTGFFPTLYLFN
jgi:hypothetical protein